MDLTPKSFRLNQEDMDMLEKVKKERGFSKDIDVLRYSLRVVLASMNAPKEGNMFQRFSRTPLKDPDVEPPIINVD